MERILEKNRFYVKKLRKGLEIFRKQHYISADKRDNRMNPPQKGGVSRFSVIGPLFLKIT